MEADIIYKAIISIVISIIIFAVIKMLMSSKLANLKGTQKLLGLISVIIVGIELAFLGILFDLFTIAASVIASVGVAFALVSFALQNHLKNMISGIGLYMNKRINIGDIIEVDGTKGTITEFQLMKTVAVTEDGKFMSIPNLKFNESVVLISHKEDDKKRDDDIDKL
ncbi:mechanosensitive ion channel domain-containing protein [Nitrosopumilus sp.]|uniref:mechanosensitive ion channel domain-containing protein n=1 Tax=Nitrosopumilus sp. TaxID=2024843 RepID=UPI00292FFADC|nr:mechanosensitive ion channel domain-containing protein [Nitrosopumilus sp.]